MRRTERGLTALEVMVATAILGGVLVYVFRSVDALTSTTVISEKRVTAAAENFRGLEALRDDLRLAVAASTGPNRYLIGPAGAWISYRLVDGEVKTPGGRVVPVLSPRIYVFLDGGHLIRAVVDESETTGPEVSPSAVQDVWVLARNVAEVEFGDPLLHSGAFAVTVTTLVGDPETDAHVQARNHLLVTPLNRSPIVAEATDDTFAVPVPVMVYTSGTRRTFGPHLEFTVQNTTEEDLVVNGFRLDWSPDEVSYAQDLRFDGGKVWRANHDPEEGVGSGETRYLTEVESFTIPPSGQLTIRFDVFKRHRDGSGASVSQSDEDPYVLTLLLDAHALDPVTIPPDEDDD